MQGKPNLTPTQAAGRMAFDTVSRTITRAQDMLSPEKQTELLATAAKTINKAVETGSLEEITAARETTVKAILQEINKK